MQTDPILRVALVGFGLSGRYLQAPFFETNPRFHLKTVVTNRQDPRIIFPKVERKNHLSEVLSDPDIDLISICSPNETHFEYARQCLLAGKNVLVEKPFTATVQEAEVLIELAETQGKHLFVFQNRRFDSDFLTVRHVVEQGWLGNLLRFEAHYDRYKPILNPKKWKETTGPGSGILYDLGSHIIDQSIALFGAPQSVWGKTYRQREGSTIDDAFDAWLDYGGLKVHLSSSLMVRAEMPRYVLHGTKGSFVKFGIDPQEDHLKAGLLPGMTGFGVELPEYQGVLNTEMNGVQIRGKVEPLHGQWTLLFENIADVLLRGAKPLIALEEVVKQMRVIDGIVNGAYL